MSNTGDDSSTPSTKMKDEPILFHNATEDYSGIIRFERLFEFWLDLEAWVRAMLIECPEERHDPWYKKWQSYSKFHLNDPKTAPDVFVLLIMEDMQNDYTILQVFESLVKQIPFLNNHIYFSPADENDESIAVKLKMFQSYDYITPYHQPPYSNPANVFHALAHENTEDQFNAPPTNDDDKIMPDPNDDDEKVKKPPAIDAKMNINDGSDSNALDGSLFSLSNEERNVNAEDGGSLSRRQLQKQRSLQTLIQQTCKKEIAAMQNELISTIHSSIMQMTSNMPQPSSHFAANPPRFNTPPPSNGLPQENNAFNDKNSASSPVPSNFSSTIPSNTINIPPTYQNSNLKYGSSSNPPNFGRWNTAWKHKSNPHYSNLNTKRTSNRVHNPYTTSSANFQPSANAPPAGNNPHQHTPLPFQPPSFNTPSAHPSMFQHGSPHHVKGGVTNFIYDGLHYELRDTDFIKYAGDLLEVTCSDDIIHFYKHLQTMAIQRNIFVQDFEKLKYWNKSSTNIPTTCIFGKISSHDNTELAFKRMRTCLYQKISKAIFHHPEHKAIILNHSIAQDGFAVLYDLATKCHPHLLAKTSKYQKYNSRPQMASVDNIYTLKRKYESWLEIERVDNHVYTDECVLRYIMQDLQDDTRYDRALRQMEVDLATHDTMKRNSTSYIHFPSDLLLTNIPETVMACYTDDEKKSLFSDASIVSQLSSSSNSSIEVGFVKTLFANGDHDVVQDFINAMKDTQRMPARLTSDEFCQGCGKYGHDIFHQGCDFCAQLSLALKFLETHPKDSKKVIRDYMTFQRERQKNRQQNASITHRDTGNSYSNTRRHDRNNDNTGTSYSTTKRHDRNKDTRNRVPYKKKSFRATVKAIQSALSDYTEDPSDPEDEDEFLDAETASTDEVE